MRRHEDVPLETWLPWAAGLFEGEGTVVLNRDHSIRMALISNDADVVYRFCAAVRCGQVYGPRTRPRAATPKPYWTWHCSGYEPMARLYGLLLPWLGERRRAKFERILVEGKPLYPTVRCRAYANAYELEEAA